jgi:CRP-like cAMP-binding protein
MQYADEASRAQPYPHVTSTDGHHRSEAAVAQVTERNRLLRALSLDDYAALLPKLAPVRLHSKQVLVEPGVALAHAWFMRRGVASTVAVDEQGDSVEVVSVGLEGFVGLPLLLDDDTLPNRVIVAVEGDAWRIPADEFRRVLDERSGIRKMCLRYASCFTGQLAQAVACNRSHTVEQRCARWLLRTHERVHQEPFIITHEFLAFILGVRRAGVTVAMGALQDAGAIQYHRGRIAIADRAKLERASCSCYRFTETALARLG